MVQMFIRHLLILAVLVGGLYPAIARAGDSAYDRVMATKTLTCGYMIYDPYLTKDMKTNKVGGLIVDYMDQIAARQGFKIDWAADVNVDQIITNLNYGRIDAFCVPTTPDDNWAKLAEFVADVGAWPYYAYVRADNTLTRDQLNTARVVLVEGYNSTITTTEHLPQANFVNLLQIVSAAE